MFGTSRIRKAIHMEMEKQIFGKRMLVRESLTIGHREDFDQRAFLRFLHVYHTLAHIKL